MIATINVEIDKTEAGISIEIEKEVTDHPKEEGSTEIAKDANAID